MNAKLDGQYDFGFVGMVPMIRVDAPRPKLVNNGYCCYSGIPELHVPGLRDALPDDGRPIRQGHVMLVFADGQHFSSYASIGRDDTRERFRFS